MSQLQDSVVARKANSNMHIPHRHSRGLFAPGFFLSVEGMDGSGKTTMVERIGIELKQWGVPVTVLRDPGGTPGGEAMREVLKDASLNLDANAQGLLFFASREQLIREQILPALNRGEVVVSDRYVDSSFAMQYWAGKMDPDLFQTLADRALSLASPELTLYLDVPVEISRERQRVRGTDASKDAYESQDDTYHEMIREAYLELEPRHGPTRVRTIDASRTQKEVERDVLAIVRKRIIKPKLGNIFDKSWWKHKFYYHSNTYNTTNFPY